MSELCIALEAEPADLRWYLDLSNGDVILVGGDYEPEENDGLTISTLAENTQRFRQVPSAEAADLVGDMTAFTAQLADVQLKESLELALSAPRPDRRFRAALGWLPDELERWQSFRQARCEARATAWLESLGISPAFRALASATSG
jgi:hypothetical protein